LSHDSPTILGLVVQTVRFTVLGIACAATIYVAGCALEVTGVSDAGASASGSAGGDATGGGGVAGSGVGGSGTSATGASSGGAGGARLVPPSCKAILLAEPYTPSGPYEIDPTGSDPHLTYCDMTTDVGGWTKVTQPVDTPEAVAALVGGSGRQMLKCTDAGEEHVISPSFASWSWTPGQFVRIAGTWIANGASTSCGADPEYTTVPCTSWFGVGCGDGPGNKNKLFPGVSDANGGTCAGAGTAHTNGALTVCDGASGPYNYASWVVFLREDD
jgi:hypothetical protein